VKEQQQSHRETGLQRPETSLPGQSDQQPEQLTRPYRRVAGVRFGRGIDLAPFTPEEEEEIRCGVSEWEIQSRRIKHRLQSSRREGGQQVPHDLDGQEQLNRKAKEKAAKKRSYLKHRTKRLEYQRNYEHTRYRQQQAKRQEQQSRLPNPLRQQNEVQVTREERVQPVVTPKFPPSPQG
jgi:hypothetical protein